MFDKSKKFTLGRTSKNGPIQSSTKSSSKQEIKDASWVLPPTVCCISDLDSEAEKGMHEKNDASTFPDP